MCFLFMYCELCIVNFYQFTEQQHCQGYMQQSHVKALTFHYIILMLNYRLPKSLHLLYVLSSTHRFIILLL